MGNPVTFTVKFANVLVRLYMIYALVVSFLHIVHAANLLGLYGWQAYSVPVAIDGLALFGMMIRSEKFAPETRRMGKFVALGAGTLSMVANVYAGHTAGERAFGVLAVTLFLLMELLAAKVKAAPTAAEIAAAKKAASIAQGVATRKANAAKTPAKAKTRKPAAKPAIVKPAAPEPVKTLTLVAATA